MSDPHETLANKLADAIDAVERANRIRLTYDIEDFGDLNLIIAELRSMHERARTTRFKERQS